MNGIGEAMTISQMVLIAYLCICLALYCQHLYESWRMSFCCALA